MSLPLTRPLVVIGVDFNKPSSLKREARFPCHHPMAKQEVISGLSNSVMHAQQLKQMSCGKKVIIGLYENESCIFLIDRHFKRPSVYGLLEFGFYVYTKNSRSMHPFLIILSDDQDILEFEKAKQEHYFLEFLILKALALEENYHDYQKAITEGDFFVLKQLFEEAGLEGGTLVFLIILESIREKLLYA